MALGGKDGIWPATAAAKPDEGGAKFLPNQTGCFRLDTQQSLVKTFIYRTRNYLHFQFGVWISKELVKVQAKTMDYNFVVYGMIQSIQSVL